MCDDHWVRAVQPARDSNMLEPARRHGPFDSRYPIRPKIKAQEWEPEQGDHMVERLGWTDFLARFFPARHRHDFEALTAYESYRNALRD